MDDTGHHIRQRKSRLKPLSLSTNIYMPFHYILHFLSQNDQPWFHSQFLDVFELAFNV